MAINRSSIRRHVASLLSENVRSSQNVWPYQKAKLQGTSPIITVTSSGTYRPPLTTRGSSTVIRLTVSIYVLHSAPGWTEEQAEDQLDQLESEIAEVLTKYGGTPFWNSLRWEAPSMIGMEVQSEGEAYLYETIPLEVTVL